MTENYPTGSTPPPGGESLAAGDVAREQASGVAAEAGRQGRNPLEQVQGQVHEQAAGGQQQIAKKLLPVGDELRSMAENSSQGAAADLAQHRQHHEPVMPGTGWRTANSGRW